ncbi:S8 family peptidase [Streptomyces sp. NBC_01304]|uniref:S8 family peptidase n=1 Tax=Streptomyces sp. NBC_01304 TaxID=2903818 RepID=UPI002E138244|nr:S8 family serine peptidase [Streptomyces sp. NBC_01304]
MKRACASTIAAAAAVALAAGMTSPAAAKAEATAGAAGAERITPNHRIQLITGDRVVVDAKGKVLGLEPAKGREHIPVQVQRHDGHTSVVPYDARRLIAAGKLDARLFDITELNKAQIRKAQKKGLQLIVGYKGAASAAKAEVRGAGDTTLRRTLKSLNADAIRTPKDDAAKVWEALTNEQRGSRSTASGVAKVWLDGVRKASLDKSVKQIGADKAWAAGFDGKGVKIAVLDTGVDKTHPDLKDQVIGEKNFSTAADAVDRFGHGTHVASIAAGTGAKSGGKYKGVAPGAKVISGKVLDDNGYGDDSGILAGLEWAAAEGADVVNLSLGGGDTPEIDPLEAAVNKLSAEKGILFAIAAGNSGPGDSTVGSPGSAEAALTVGAVDKSDKLADFSSRGPRIGDGAIKPDVTGPGVDITAAAAPGSVIDKEPGVPHPAPGYFTISGTSMATPHVAGAAAILKQQHPDWKSAELKGALTASTKGGKYTAFQQGSGRIQVDQAIKQNVIAEPVSVSFGVAQWPHTDDAPISKKVTYKNLGKDPVTLDLKATGLDPKGNPAPAGFFKVSADKVTVPAGGTAAVDVTADTKLGGNLNGSYSAYVVATGGGQSVRTAAAVEREVESYDVTLKNIDREGNDAKYFGNNLIGVSGSAEGRDFYTEDQPGTVKFRAPKGGYILNADIVVDPRDFTKGADWIAQPKLTVNKDTTLTLDARTTKPVDFTVPGGAKAEFASPEYTVEAGNGSYGFGWWLDGYTNFRTAHLGPEVTDGTLSQTWDGHFIKDAKSQYSVVYGGKVKKLATGYTKHVKQSELATLKVGLGASSAGKKGNVTAFGMLPGSNSASAFSPTQSLPSTRTLYVSTSNKTEWDVSFEQQGPPDEEGFPTTEAYYTLGAAQIYEPGKTYEKVFNTGVFGPRVSKSYGVFRTGNQLYGYLPVFADGKGHAGSSLYSDVKTTLYRNGTKLAENDNPLTAFPGEDGAFKVPSGDAAYKLTSSIKRKVAIAAAATRIDVSFSFRSKKVTDETALPVSTARFSAPVDLSSRAEADKKVDVPVSVQGAAAGSNLKSLYTYVSYDYGQTWKQVKVKNGKISVKNPAKGKGISFHAKITDKKGNKSTVSIYNAYYGK